MAKIGQFEVVEELGRGAMGVVFRGFDPAIGRPVAIKIIRAQPFANNQETQQARLRFAREAAAAGRLSHPNIVTVFQLGEEPDYQYLVMELVDGKGLEHIRREGQPISPARCLPILRQLGSALDYAHAQGVVHRDIKPANILLRSDGQVKLTDFGIARIASQTMTHTGAVLGTPAYVAPEQIAGSRVDGKADQFSFAAVAFELLTGRMPFPGPTGHAMLFAILQGERPAAHEINPAVPPAMSEVLKRALAIDPANRFPACSQFVEALEEASLQPPETPTPTRILPAMQAPSRTIPQPAKPAAKKISGIGAMVAGVVLGAALLAGVYQLIRVRSNGKEIPAVKHETAVAPAPVTPASQPIVPQPAKPVADAPPHPPREYAKARKNFTPPPSTVVTPPPATVVAPPPTVVTTPAVPAVVTPPPAAPASRIVKLNARDGQQYVWIPSGAFQMGCSPGDTDCEGSEKPAHAVTLTKGFWIGRTEVTQRAYRKVMGEDPSALKGPDLPVETVSWDQAARFCEAAGMRLPTEAEWEYAARGGNPASRYGAIEAIAWHGGNSGNQTHDVGQKQPNAFGLYDMLGDVWEWVADRFGNYEPGDQRDPRGPATGQFRVLRGGSWGLNPRLLRASLRSWCDSGCRLNYIGFRCAGELP